MPTLDFTYLKKFRGFIGWAGYTDGAGNVVPPMEIELFVGNYQMPIRKPKITEHVTVSQLDPMNHQQIGSAAVFYGAPDLLQMEITGWIITLQSNRRWIIKDANGSNVSSTFGNIPYAEVINAYLSGRMNISSGGAMQRKDPDYYISPQGYRYTSPIVSVFQPTGTINVKKQTFQMTLLLES